MTPQQHKQHLLALAEWMEEYCISCSPKEKEIVNALRDFAARLTPGVSDAMVEKAAMAACNAWMAAPIGTPDGDAVWRGKAHEMRTRARAALEAVFPLVDDGQAKDLSHLPAPLTRQDLIDIGREQFQNVYGGDNHEGALIAAIEAALDAREQEYAAMAAPPKDEHHEP